MGILASSGMDRRSIVWDLSKDGSEEIPYGLVYNILKVYSCWT